MSVMFVGHFLHNIINIRFKVEKEYVCNEGIIGLHWYFVFYLLFTEGVIFKLSTIHGEKITSCRFCIFAIHPASAWGFHLVI